MWPFEMLVQETEICNFLLEGKRVSEVAAAFRGCSPAEFWAPQAELIPLSPLPAGDVDPAASVISLGPVSLVLWSPPAIKREQWTHLSMSV